MLTLYLVSACQTEADIAKYGLEGRDGHYWKVGITFHENPLKRDPARYQEAFRAVRLEDDQAKLTEYVIKETFQKVRPSKGTTEGLAYSAGLEVATTIFDFFVNECIEHPETFYRGCAVSWITPRYDYDEGQRESDRLRENIAAIRHWRARPQEKELLEYASLELAYFRLRLRKLERVGEPPSPRAAYLERFWQMRESCVFPPEPTAQLALAPMW